jgi:phospholipase/carboxylesterase
MVGLLRCVEVGPAEGAEASVIWLHGLGASGHDFEDVPPLIGLPRARFVFPHAPNRPVTINMGLIMPAWFDVRGLGGRGDDGVADEHEAGVRDSAAHITALIEREKQRGVPCERVVLGGFSQGGAMALFVGARHPERLGGIMVLSGWELARHTREAEESPANRRTPLLVCHGRHDPMVPFRGGQAAYEAYARDGRPAEFHAFPMEHSVCMEEIAVIRAWLHACLPPAAAADGPASPATAR